MERIYISGKIGEEVIRLETRLKFEGAAEMLRSRGYDVFNPTDAEWQESLRKGFDRDRIVQPNGDRVGFYAYALLRDLMVIATCDGVLFLDDIRKSPGGLKEYQYCLATGIRCFFTDRHESCKYLYRQMLELVRNGRPPRFWLDDELKAEIQYYKDHIERVWLPLTGDNHW